MDTHSYWHKQTLQQPLYPDIAWSKPEQRSLAGKLGVIGGNKLGFLSIAESYTTALRAGTGQVRILLPDALQKLIPATITEALFAPTTPSGSLAKDALPEMRALGEWANHVLLIGDAGRNSETAIAYEEFIAQYSGAITITRDALDLLRHSSQALVDRSDTTLVMSFAQLQKLFQAIYYPKMLTFRMQLIQLVETLHKFTITYPATICVLHEEHCVVSSNGEVTTMPWNNPMAIWRGDTATKAAVYQMWNPQKKLAAITASLLISS